MQVTNGGLPRPRQGTGVGHVLSPLDNSPPLGGSIDGRLRGTIQSAPAPQQPRTQHSQIAIQFVKDFYLTLASQGESVWPYYHENDSVLSRPEESHASNDNSNVTGQLHIYRTLASLGLKSSRYKINTVDSQPSVDGGVHLLVTGLVQGTSTRAEAPRTFTQSFHLARTKDGGSYYIRNDILRIVGAAPVQARPQAPAQPQPAPQPQPQPQPQQSQPQPQVATLPVARPRAIPSTTQINQLSVSLTNSSTAPSLPATQTLKSKAKDFDDTYDPIVISSSTTHSISHTLNNATAVPDKIISHTPQVQVSTAVSSIPPTTAPQVNSKPKWGDREEKFEEDDEDEDDYDDYGKKYDYEIKKEAWVKKTQPVQTQPQPVSQPVQTQPQPVQTPPQPVSQPAQTQSQPVQTQSQPVQTQPQPVQTQSQPTQAPINPQRTTPTVQQTQQPAKPVQTSQPVAPAPQRQVPAKPSAPAQTQPAPASQQSSQTPQVQVQPQVQTQVQPPQAQQTHAKPVDKAQTQTQVQTQVQQKHVQPTKPREAKTYAGRIGIRPTATGYYRQPAPPKAVTYNEEYRRKDGGGRGRGGQGQQQGQQSQKGAGRGQGKEFRPISKEPTPSLFVSNLPEDANESSVADRFKVFGAVKNVDFPSDKNFCFVHFESQEGVDKAMSTEDEFLWDGYSIWYEPKRVPVPRGGGGGNNGVGKGSAPKTTPTPNENKHDSVGNGKDTSGKAPSQNQKQRSQSQHQQEPADDQGAWKKVEHRSTRRKQAEKKGEKKAEKKSERK